MLSWEKSDFTRPIAKIKGKKKSEDKILYLVEEGGKPKKIFKEVKLKSEKFIPLPNKKVVEKLYISAPSGAGKSTYAGNYLKEYIRMFPEDEIFVLSSIGYDKVLDKYDPVRLDLQDLLTEPLEMEELANSIVVLDDIDTIKNVRVRRMLQDLRDHLLETGRHYKIRMICTSHIMMNYKSTSRLLNEATSVTFFPRAASTYHIKRFLKIYGGLEKKQIKKILKLPSRWVTLNRTYPNYILYEKGAYTLYENDEQIE